MEVNYENEAENYEDPEETDPAPTDLENFELEPEVLFEGFVQKYGKKYANKAERMKRFSIFQENLLTIKARNADPDNPAEYGIDEFTDQRFEEYGGGVLPLDYFNVDDDHVETLAFDGNVTGLPEFFDWRQHGAVTRVKNQVRVFWLQYFWGIFANIKNLGTLRFMLDLFCKWSY